MPLTADPQPDRTAGVRMQWKVPVHLRRLVDLDENGYLRDILDRPRQPLYVPPGLLV